MYQCDKCGYIFKEPTKIKYDVFYDLVDKRKKVIGCPKCDGTFTEILICDKCHCLYLNGDKHKCSKEVKHDK